MYYPILEGATTIGIHPAYIVRRTLMTGVLPTLVLMALSAYWWQYKALFFLLWPLLVAWRSWLSQTKFKLYLFEDVLFISRGAWRVEHVLLKWNVLQATATSAKAYTSATKPWPMYTCIPLPALLLFLTFKHHGATSDELWIVQSRKGKGNLYLAPDRS